MKTTLLTPETDENAVKTAAELGMGAVRTAGRSKRIDTKVSILLGLQFPLFLSLAKIGERRPLRK